MMLKHIGARAMCTINFCNDSLASIIIVHYCLTVGLQERGERGNCQSAERHTGDCIYINTCCGVPFGL